MESRVRLGHVWGIPIGLHPSWFFIFGLVTFSLAVGYFPDEYPDMNGAAYWILGAITSLLFFGSVLAHELGHSFVAIRNKIPVRSITLFIFGGVAQIEEEPRTAGAEFRIAIAGPIVSLALAAVFYVIWLADRNVSTHLAAPSVWLARINLILAVFNMIPGFPLDGGRVFRAVVWQFTGSLHRATRIAATMGQVVAFGFMAWGAFTLLAGGVFNGLWLIFIGWFLQNAATASAAQSGLQEALRGVTVSQVMTTECAHVPHRLSIKELVDEQILSGRPQRCFFVDEGDATRGLLTIQDVTAISRDEWNQVTAEQIMVPWDQIQRVTPSTELLDALRIMDRAQVGQVPVVVGEELVGMLTREQVIRYVRMRSELGL